MKRINSKYILSCDIGGTHITSALVDISNWEIIEESIVRNQVNSGGNAKSIFHEWATNINESVSKMKHQIHSIGIAMPGPFDYDNGISLMKNQSKYDALYELNTTEGILSNLTDKNINIKYINDAAAFLQGEVYASMRENEDIILGITLGTGLGSAVKIKNQKAFDADLWDSPYKNSIYEEYLVTRWFTNRFYELKGVKEKGLKEIIENHQQTDEFKTLIQEYRIHLHDFLAFFSQKYNSNNFIIGGNISKGWDIINDNQTFKDFNISIGQYAEKAALIGAASLFNL